MYLNPIIPGFCPDPSITYAEGTYYLVTSTFEFFPGVTIWESQDLLNWKYTGPVLDRESQLDLSGSLNSQGLYAATIRYDGKRRRFYMVTTNKYTRMNFVCHTDDIHGPWSEISPISPIGIDPSLLFLSDGRCFYTSNGSIDGVKGHIGAFINPDTGELLEPLQLISTGCGGTNTEGPHIYEKDGWYYLMVAEGGTERGHHECILRSRDIHGPYEANPRNPILGHHLRKGHPIQATGHADLIQRPDGSWVAVFLGVREPKRPQVFQLLGRETFLAPVDWSGEWPVIGNKGLVELEMEGIEGEQKRRPDYSVSFSTSYKDTPYFKVRKPKDECYLEDTEKETLTLLGEESLSRHLGFPTLLLWRMKGWKDSAEVTIDVDTMEGKGGITSFLNSDYHYRLQVEKKEDGLRVSLIRHIHDAEFSIDSLDLMMMPRLKLSAECDGEYFHFLADGKEVGKASAAGISSPSTMYMTFTGVMWGIWAENGKVKFLERVKMQSK